MQDYEAIKALVDTQAGEKISEKKLLWWIHLLKKQVEAHNARRKCYSVYERDDLSYWVVVTKTIQEDERTVGLLDSFSAWDHPTKISEDCLWWEFSKRQSPLSTVLKLLPASYTKVEDLE